MSFKITGMYRDTTDGTWIHVREAYGHPDVYDLEWKDPDTLTFERTRVSRTELDEMLVAGKIRRDYTR